MPLVRLCFLLSGLALFSCRQNRLQLEAINTGLEVSTRVLQANCDTTVSALIHGSRYIIDQYWAVRWQPVAAKETLLAIQTAGYIDSPQNELHSTHKIAGDRIRILFDTLLHYKQSLPGPLHSLQSQTDFRYISASLPDLYSSLAVLPGYPVSSTPESGYLRWKDSTFGGDEMLTRVALTNLKHDLILSAYQLIQFVREEIREFVEDFTQFDAIESLSAEIVKAGGTIQVTAGFGSFKSELRPTITIGNEVTPLTDNAVAIKTIKAPQKPGKYAIPIRLAYTKPDGTRAWKDDTLHYVVVAP